LPLCSSSVRPLSSSVRLSAPPAQNSRAKTDL
jgi:hypothetical protein